jgi:metal-responsive CopG/Arc/MetJ family transcriptional regulator
MQAHRRVVDSRERCNLRLPEGVVRAIDEARVKRPGFVSRNSWIAEAIQDKLKGEGIELRPEAWTANDA